ncbi:hypothetical protein Bbelb_081400 [Branchiostoma belcheri]|nr:hypothetical protein Bbelb_081400 [Branchiostoma belcheri]
MNTVLCGHKAQAERQKSGVVRELGPKRPGYRSPRKDQKRITKAWIQGSRKSRKGLSKAWIERVQEIPEDILWKDDETIPVLRQELARNSLRASQEFTRNLLRTCQELTNRGEFGNTSSYVHPMQNSSSHSNKVVLRLQ